MNVLVDTAVWSLALRRGKPRGTAEELELVELINEGRVAMIGPVRQEVLSGIRTAEQLGVVRDRLRAFPDLELTTEDFEEAASCYNRCRARGIQGASTDFLICAVSVRHELAVFTTDVDFEHFARVLHIRLHKARRKP